MDAMVAMDPVLRLSDFTELERVAAQGSSQMHVGRAAMQPGAPVCFLKEVVKSRTTQKAKGSRRGARAPEPLTVNEYGVHGIELAVNEMFASRLYGGVYGVPVLDLSLVVNDSAAATPTHTHTHTHTHMQRYLLASRAVVKLDTCA
jgi:hypothetical protein